MDGYQAVLMDVWREACRHIEVSESTDTIASLLAAHLPIECVMVRRLDPERLCLETTAVGPASAECPSPETRNEYSAADMDRLLAWCRAGQVTHVNASTDALREILLPGPVEGDLLAGPLQLPADRFGVLLLVSRRGAHFELPHVMLAQLLLEPFSVAHGEWSAQ